MSCPKPTKNQLLLYEYMVNYAVDIILSNYNIIIEFVYEGKNFLDANLQMMICEPVEDYLNYCAYKISSREDKYINTAFDTMSAIKLDNTNHPQDILVEIMNICSRLITEVNPIHYINNDYELRDHMLRLLHDNSDYAAKLTGCAPDHIHPVIKLNDKVFALSISK